MVAADRKTALHAAEILGVFLVAHHFWPKGITYGAKEDWEKAYRKKHANDSSRSRSRSRSRLVEHNSGTRDGEVEREREVRYEEYDELVREKRYLETDRDDGFVRKERVDTPRYKDLGRYYYDDERQDDRQKETARYYDDERRAGARY